MGFLKVFSIRLCRDRIHGLLSYNIKKVGAINMNKEAMHTISYGDDDKRG
jgi:hypothetical protein